MLNYSLLKILKLHKFCAAEGEKVSEMMIQIGCQTPMLRKSCRLWAGLLLIGLLGKNVSTFFM